MQSSRLLIPALALATWVAIPSPAQEATAAPAAEPTETVPPKLQPGEFDWHPERSPAGPVLIVVSRDDQLVYVYRNGIEIARSTVSTGKPGHGTPTGVFQILQKHKDHHSSTYNNAPMPYMQRLTWDGIALHAGKLPGYPASHGCIRLPYEFSQKLFGVTAKGGTVVITSVHAKPIASLDPYAIFHAAGKSLKEAGAIHTLDPNNIAGWHPERQEEGHLAIVVSTGDGAIHALRDGVEIGRAKFALPDPEMVLPTAVYVMLDHETDEESPVIPGRKHKAWATVALHQDGDPNALWKAAAEADIPEDFLQALYRELEPGTLLIVTPDRLDPTLRSDPGFTIVTAETHTDEAPPEN